MDATAAPLLPPTKPKARKITNQDAEAIAGLVAKRLTETEACLTLGIEPRRWWVWKQRKASVPKFEALTTRMRADYIRGNIEQMEKAASGRDGVRHDWRAADRLNAIVAPERYGQQIAVHDDRPSVAPTVNVWVQIGQELARPAAEVVDVQAKQLPEKCPEPSP